MDTLANQTVGQIAAADFRAAQVFEKYEIDFSFNGKRTLQEAAEDEKIDQQSLTDEIELATKGTVDASLDFSNWSLDTLADYIVRKHHKFAETQIGLLKPQLEALSQRTNSPESKKIQAFFQEVAGEIVTHQKKEEIMLFPQIKKMVKAAANGEKLPKTPFGGVFGKVNMLIEEHVGQGALFDKIMELGDQCMKEGDVDCQSLLNQLREFKKDLHRHIHLENNILFPKALRLENSLLN